MQHICQSQIDQFKHTLLEKLHVVRIEIAKSLSSSTELIHQQQAKNLPMLTTDELLDLAENCNLTIINDKAKDLRCIDATLNNIEIDMFGLCSDCEEEIEYLQLLKDPTTQRCQRCELKYESQINKGFKL